MVRSVLGGCQEPHWVGSFVVSRCLKQREKISITGENGEVLNGVGADGVGVNSPFFQ